MQPLTCSLTSSPTCEGCWSSISAGGLVVDNARFATSDPPRMSLVFWEAMRE